MNLNVTLLPGDGVGPEVVGQAVLVLEEVAKKYGHQLDFDSGLIGGCSIDRFGSSLTDETVAACKRAGAVLMGAVGGPKWDDPSAKDRPEVGLLRIRKELGVFANLRPVSVHPALVASSPLKPEKLAGVDMIVVRELTGGLYFGQPKGRDMVDGKERAFDTLEYFDFEIRRVVEMAFKLAREQAQESDLGGQGQCAGIVAPVAADRRAGGQSQPGYHPGACAGGYRRHEAGEQSRRSLTWLSRKICSGIS